MNYIALLRGINVGGKRKVEMKRLKALFESLGYTNVSTYLNSGNLFFESSESKKSLQDKIPKILHKEFAFEIKTLIRTQREIIKIAKAIPQSWNNDSEQKTDIAYLFPSIDSQKTIAKLPLKTEYIQLKYVKGAIIWNVKRSEYNKSHLNKLIGLKLYQEMTVRNVNTARFLAGMKK